MNQLINPEELLDGIHSVADLALGNQAELYNDAWKLRVGLIGCGIAALIGTVFVLSRLYVRKFVLGRFFIDDCRYIDIALQPISSFFTSS